MLQGRQLTYYRGEKLIWENINFELVPGKLLQITGENGCGKTSLLRVLAGLVPPTSGKLYWQDSPIDKQTGYSQQLHYFGHQPGIKNELTVKENLRFCLSSTSEKSRLTAIERFGLSAQADSFGYQLSHGQKQRVALARLLLSAAPLWILDEPLAGLDSEMIETLQHIFADHLAHGGMIVLSTHWPLTSAVLPQSLRLDLKSRENANETLNDMNRGTADLTW
jgi:heme exporter protein A